MKLKIKQLHPYATIPKYATAGAACFDLYAISKKSINAFRAEIFETGLCFEIPENHVMMVFSRSGHGFKNGVRLANCTGIIDSDFRGEVMVKLQNDSSSALIINDGDRVAQAMILPIQQVCFEVTDQLSETKRGKGGFGSTGS